jgi:RNA polymerase sigma-70 factor (ECF subfamily)
MRQDPGRLSAEELARDARAGSSPAVEELVRRFERPLHRFLCLRTGSAEDAEELTQDSFVRAWQRIGRYDPRRSFAAWLYTVARRLAASRARVVKRTRPLESAPEPAHTQDPPGLLGAREERENLWATARRLCPADAVTALWLRHAEELSVTEIARVLGRREATVRVLMFRARTKLAEHVAPAPRAGRAASSARPLAPAHMEEGRCAP